MANLALLCRFHHKTIHKGRFTMSRARDDTLATRRPDGQIIDSPPRPRPAHLARGRPPDPDRGLHPDPNPHPGQRPTADIDTSNLASIPDPLEVRARMRVDALARRAQYSRARGARPVVPPSKATRFGRPGGVDLASDPTDTAAGSSSLVDAAPPG